MRCSCKHEQQDKIYGEGLRLHNVCGKGEGKGKIAYCTVCCPKQPKNKVLTPPNPILGIKNTIQPDKARQGKTIPKLLVA